MEASFFFFGHAANTDAVATFEFEANKKRDKKKCDTFSICACHPCAGAMLIFSVSFQFLRMTGFDPGSTALAAAMATEVDPPLALNTHLFGAGLRAKEKCVCCAQIL